MSRRRRIVFWVWSWFFNFVMLGSGGIFRLVKEMVKREDLESFFILFYIFGK